MLPLQYGQAMPHAVSHESMVSMHADNQGNELAHEQHHVMGDCAKFDQDQDIGTTSICDMDKGCVDQNHCAKCQMDKVARNNVNDKPVDKQTLDFSSANYFEFYPHPDLRPPQA